MPLKTNRKPGFRRTDEQAFHLASFTRKVYSPIEFALLMHALIMCGLLYIETGCCEPKRKQQLNIQKKYHK